MNLDLPIPGPRSPNHELPMSIDLQPNVLADAPTALSFREFRDEEIVGFFANGHRTFRPAVASGSGFGWQRLVGAVHSASERKPTAAFRTALAVKKGAAETLFPRQKSVLRTVQAPTIPLPSAPDAEGASSASPFGKQARPLGAIALAGQKVALTGGRAAKVLMDPLTALSAKSKGAKSPCPSHPGIRIDGGIKSFGEKTLENADAELIKVVERWPRLSSAAKEMIGTLVETVDP